MFLFTGGEEPATIEDTGAEEVKTVVATITTVEAAAEDKASLLEAIKEDVLVLDIQGFHVDNLMVAITNKMVPGFSTQTQAVAPQTIHPHPPLPPLEVEEEEGVRSPQLRYDINPHHQPNNSRTINNNRLKALLAQPFYPQICYNNKILC